MPRPRRILFVAPPIAPIGDGICGGVETSLVQLTRELTSRGHCVGTVAVEGSRGLTGALHTVSGRRSESVTRQSRSHVGTKDSGGALEQMWERVSALQGDYDIVLNTGYDSLSFEFSPRLKIPVMHWISICSTIDSVDGRIENHYRQHPSRFAFYSRNQADTFPFVSAETAQVLHGAVDTNIFKFVASPDARLCWSARISPEKGLEDALAASRQLNLPLDVCGRIESKDYWSRLQPRMSSQNARYHGFLSPAELSQVLGRCMAMLTTPKWNESFGVSSIEAMSCGTPVVAYASAGPAEIVQHGETGYLVETGDIGALAKHALLAASLDRQKVRARAAEFSIAALTDGLEQWLKNIVGDR